MLVFVDFCKAFDSINHATIFEILRSYGFRLVLSTNRPTPRGRRFRLGEQRLLQPNMLNARKLIYNEIEQDRKLLQSVQKGCRSVGLKLMPRKQRV